MPRRRTTRPQAVERAARRGAGVPRRTDSLPTFLSNQTVSHTALHYTVMLAAQKKFATFLIYHQLSMISYEEEAQCAVSARFLKNCVS